MTKLSTLVLDDKTRVGFLKPVHAECCVLRVAHSPSKRYTFLRKRRTRIPTNKLDGATGTTIRFLRRLPRQRFITFSIPRELQDNGKTTRHISANISGDAQAMEDSYNALATAT